MGDFSRIHKALDRHDQDGGLGCQCACHPDPQDDRIMKRYYGSQRRRSWVCRVIGHKPIDWPNPGGDVSIGCDRCWKEVG